jgi:hypothetical protein
LTGPGKGKDVGFRLAHSTDEIAKALPLDQPGEVIVDRVIATEEAGSTGDLHGFSGVCQS